ncbi:MAG: ATP-grasp domain-containing protein [Pseudomonadales bacterium]|nr:ATP-grasp domain-containing protein [Pseudomonadales bacterium]
MIKRLLIANRGEIACRIMQTAQRLGIHCIAVYSEADRHARHVRLADEAWYVGPSPARLSYLDVPRLLGIARESNADAIHPGYGFLSENADFAQACTEQGLVFVGPPASAIRSMGSKADAKALMQVAGVPLIPGYHGADQDESTLLAAAAAIGYPLLIKASAGGGGKGMRTVTHASGFIAALQSARREALASFADDRVLLEKLVYPARHVEVQVLADQHGHVLSLLDRDCSLQRRHQKVLEEAPAPGIPDAVREAMAAAARRAASAVDYVNAGTLEFLLDAEHNFYFMEMNTRLQVEHPVTELVTGLDLVEWQLRIASGEVLTVSQDDIKARGAAVEVRLYAEDPAQDFMPSSGHLSQLSWTPQPGLRVDCGVEAGDTVSEYYDAMLGKFITWGQDRAEAFERIRQTLARLKVQGLRHNAGFLYRLCTSQDILAARLDTGFIARHPELTAAPEFIDKLPTLLWAALAAALSQRRQASAPPSPWLQLHDWRMQGPARQTLRLSQDDEPVQVVLLMQGTQIHWQLSSLQGQLRADYEGSRLHIEHEGRRTACDVHIDGDHITLFHQGQTFICTLVRHRSQADTADRGQGTQAPMTGRVIEVSVQPGMQVHIGDTLFLLEAMKMEHRLTASRDGCVGEVMVSPGDLVQSGQSLMHWKEV